MAEYTGPSTDNEADVIATMDGHIVPDRYSTGIPSPTDDKHGRPLKLGDPHPKRIHNDIYERYGQDAPEGYSNC